jgi:divalent metal cation (Fe/Co/Zn/Cd) transporter
MQVTKNLGLLLLSIWLILHALISLFSISFTGLPIIMACLALLTGVVIVFTGGQGKTAA